MKFVATVAMIVGTLLVSHESQAATWGAKDSELLFSLSNPPSARAFKCPSHWKDAWCTFAKNYASMFLPRAPRVSTKEPTLRKMPVPFLITHVEELQGDSFDKAYDKLLSAKYRKTRTLEPFVERALKTTSCPRYLSLALAHRWELELPGKDAEKQISKLYAHALGCNNYSDVFRVRAGLLEYLFGNKSTALSYLDSALQTTDKRENFRALYWAKRIAGELGKKDLEAKYQDKLFTQFPLSYYTILLKEENKIDTLKAFGPQITARPKLNATDTDMFELVLTQVLNHPLAGPKESKLISYLASKQDQKIEEPNLKALCKIMDEKGLYRAKILLLNKQLDTSVAGLNRSWIEELYPLAYLNDIKRISKKAHPFVVMGFMRQESGFDKFSESPVGARGLLQLMPATAKWVNGRKKMKSLLDPEFNILLGSTYVQKNLDRFDGSLLKAAASYNGGFGFVRRWEKRYQTKDVQLWSDLIPFGETRNYVPSVLVNAYWYQKLYGKLAPSRVPSSVSDLFRFVENANPQ